VVDYFRRVYDSPSLTHACFPRWWGENGMPLWQFAWDHDRSPQWLERGRLLPIMRQLALQRFEVIQSPSVGPVLVQCPHYWFAELECQLAAEIGPRFSGEIQPPSITISSADGQSSMIMTAEELRLQVRTTRVVILNRPSYASRTITNIDDLVNSIRSQSNPESPIDISVIDFDSMNITQQLQTLSCSPIDLFLFVHGAGAAMLHFLPQRVTLVEICPRTFNCFYRAFGSTHGHEYHTYNLDHYPTVEGQDTGSYTCIGGCGKEGKVRLPINHFMNERFNNVLNSIRERKKQWHTGHCVSERRMMKQSDPLPV
jgi:hypothetical protein